MDFKGIAKLIRSGLSVDEALERIGDFEFNGNIETTGNISLGDNGFLFFGDGNDGRFYSDGTHTYVRHQSESSNLYLENRATSGLTYIRGEDSSGVNKNIAIFGGAIPIARLYYDGTEMLRTTSVGINIYDGLSTQSARLRLAGGRTGNGYSYIDLVGDATYSEYGLRIIRNNSGANTSSNIEHRGTGKFGIRAIDGGNIELEVSTSVKLRVDSTSTAGNTALLIYDVDNATLERVTVGAADSGGAGYKVLRIPN